MELTLDQALQKGIEAHKAGKVQEADAYYTSILKANPKHPDANHNMGVLAVGVGKVEKALPFLKTALEVNPNITQFWLSYINALIKLDQMDQAKSALEKARQAGAKGESLDQIEQRIGSPSSRNSNEQDLSQNQIQHLINLYNQGQLREIINQASQMLLEFPNSSTLFNVIGVANKGLGKFEKAIEAYKKAISIKPDYAEAHNNIGNALQDQGKLDDAIEAFNKALSIKPDYAEAYNNLGITLKEKGKFDEAIEAYNKALSIKPDYAEVCNNLGNVLQDQGKLDEAIEAYNKALSIKPDYAEVYTNTTEILKVYTPQKELSHALFIIDQRIKMLSSRLTNSESNTEIISNLSEGLDYLTEDNYKYKTPLSQIYKRNEIDMNCGRHMRIFDTRNVIPEFCFGCFKVQVEVATFIDLIKLTTLFYKLDFKDDLTRKTMIEMRSNISGYYKGFIYCRGLDQAVSVKNLLDVALGKIFTDNTISKVKRGCSEYSLEFPKYGKIANEPEKMMPFPGEWKPVEDQFDQDTLIKPVHNQKSSLHGYSLGDFYIIQKWIDYAKGINDHSISAFKDKPIIFKDVYELAKSRTTS